VRELRGLAIAVALGLAIVLLSAGAARCQEVVQLIPGAVCWLEGEGTASVRLFAQNSYGVLELPILNPQPLPVTGLYQAGYCASTQVFPQDYELYLVAYGADGTPSPESNRVWVRNAP
jgi:hypothetical protein